MGGRKNYKLQADNTSELLVEFNIPWEIMVLGTKFDFRRWLYLNRPFLDPTTDEANLIKIARDEIVIAIRNAIWRLIAICPEQTIFGICISGVITWFNFLDWKYENGICILRMNDITTQLIEQYIEWLRFRPADTATKRLSYTGAKNYYTRTKSFLSECFNVGLLDRGIFPQNPFPNSNRAYENYKPYSRDEMFRLIKALSTDLLEIRNGSFPGRLNDKLAVYFFLIAARTGRNPTPLLEASRDALRPHPLNPKTKSLLVLYKRRGNNISLQSFRNSSVIEKIVTIQSDVATLFNEVLEITEQFIPYAPVKLQNSLWLHMKKTTKYQPRQISLINIEILSYAAKRFVARHELKSDDIDPKTGKNIPFQLTTMRLRKTFSTRMWQLSGGDLVKVAQELGNTPRISDMHYLQITPQMEHQHKFIGYCLEAILRDQENDAATITNIATEMKLSEEEVIRIITGKNNTGVGRCTSPFYGEHAPKDGKNVCTSFLYCFKCPNQVIMESDLYRLFSFYWLIIKERNLMDRKKWKKVYGWVIREVDGDISSKFNPKIIEEARESALVNPHPMWRDRALLGGTYA